MSLAGHNYPRHNGAALVQNRNLPDPPQLCTKRKAESPKRATRQMEDATGLL